MTIPKPEGGERELGIPTATDRLIQQVLRPILDPTFSEHRYGFRPGRSAHDAVLAAQSYVQSGRRDLEKFFDRVDHDILIDRLQKRIGDTGVIRLIRAYLNSGIMDDGVVQTRTMGTPQGGPLSPLPPDALVEKSLSFSRPVVFDYVSTHAQLTERAQRLWRALADGSIRPPNIERHPLERAMYAHTRLESRNTIGPLILLA